MHLKSIEVKGFKSFAKKTTFAFDKGVNTIIGQNGSGKSNVVDALAWVMGEQGAKNLRGSKMEDVIFAGSNSEISGKSSLSAQSSASVTLTIDNSDKALPIDFEEVSIKRVVHRAGGSEYAINGTSCRLSDVQDLLSDSGLGKQMHIIAHQGSLDRILQADEFQRRSFIEEAAGILKYRRRKNQTLNKLENTNQNLSRLEDL
ncbi:MAG: AAA family ATPase, partial [Bifidobacteriaceae bacterium]|nr:AAA family ATPase [Bifidobacteriaceae bacterium]